MRILREIKSCRGALACCGAVLAGCGGHAAKPALNTQEFVVKGVVRELEADGKTVIIRHEAISNYMPSMIMPFEVHESKVLSGLRAGDAITFNLAVTPSEEWIESISKRERSAADEVADAAGIHVTHALEPLEEGDTLPDYHFTNELGEAVSLGQYRGEALAFTFFFTSCTFPDYCPRMTRNFARAQKELEAMTNAPARWQLLSISFDPAHDTPGRLAEYGRAAQYDPRHWSFLTGEESQISGLAEQMGESYWHEGSSIGHNLRTVVVDGRGRIRKILAGNKWEVGQLVREIVRAGGH